MNKIKQLFEAFLRSGVANVALKKQIRELRKQILELRKQILELREQGIRDPLTQAYNRRFLREVGEKEFARAKRYQRPLTLIFLDIDEFKAINDQQGHLVGDQALETVAALLSNCSRKSVFIFRYGGDEFLVIMPETEKKGARQFLNRINQELSCTSLRISAGIATLEDESSLEELVEKADRRMYQKKRSKLKAWARAA